MPAKLIFFDLDGTLIDGYEYIYVHLWEYFGVDLNETREALKRYFSGKITYEEWVGNDVRLLRSAGATKAKILQAISSLRPMKGAIDTLRELRQKGYRIFVVSGGIDLVVDAIFPDHADLFEQVYINRYVFNDDGTINHAIPTKYDVEHKATCIKDVARKFGQTPADCVFVGDNVNDVQAALTAGTSIAFNSKSEELVQVATHHVQSNDLSDILPCLAI